MSLLTYSVAESESVNVSLRDSECQSKQSVSKCPESEVVEAIVSGQTRSAKPDDGFLCHYCWSQHERKDDLEAHEKLCPKGTGKYRYSKLDNNLVCPVCSKTFKRDSYIEDHIRTHFDEDAFGCKICAQSYKTRYKRNAHERTCGHHNTALNQNKYNIQ